MTAVIAHGGSGPRITVHGGNVTDTESGSASVGYYIKADGTEQDNFSTPLGNWIDKPAFAANYWVRATKTSGVNPNGGSGLGAWLQLNVDRFWQQTVAGVGARSCTLTIDVATDSGGANIVGTGAVTLDATAT